jgi:hypothetical protein
MKMSHCDQSDYILLSVILRRIYFTNGAGRNSICVAKRRDASYQCHQVIHERIARPQRQPDQTGGKNHASSGSVQSL